MGNKTEAMQQWTEFMQNKTKSSSVYIGSPCTVKQDDEDANAVLYDAVSAKADRYLLNTTFVQSETKGVVFELLKEEEENDNEENDDENADKQKDGQPMPRQNIHIKNVLLPNQYKDRLHFFKYPQVGSFLAFESSIKSYLNAEAIQAQLRPQWPRPIEEILAEQKEKEEAEKKAKEEADKTKSEEQTEKDDKAEKKEETEAPKEETEENEDDGDEEEKEAEELPPDPIQTASKYVISMDTLGDSQLYNKTTIEWIDQNITKFEQILSSIDLNQYL